MSRRFTDRQLYEVRNHIPIRHVIETLLAIESETVDGVFRFRCPLCAGYHTAIKPDTNLSRCFQCAKNFNAIDLCMLVRRTNFVESVWFLIEDKPNPSIRQIHQSRSAEESRANPSEPARAAVKKPVAIKDILPKLIAKGFEWGQKDETHKSAPQDNPSIDDIAELEHIVHVLSQMIERLKGSSLLR